MKSAILALALAGSALAQNLSGEPACASACLISAISAAGCSAGDVGCQCGPTQSAIATLVAPCLLSSCAGSALLQAESVGLALCSAYSKTAGTPATAAATTTAVGAGTTGSNSTGTTTTVAATQATGNATMTKGGATTSTGTGTGTGTGTTATSTNAAAAATLGASVLVALVGLMAVAL